MKYVALIRPPEEFDKYADDCRKRFAQHVDREPSLGSHCTLLTVLIPETAEKQLVCDLGKVVEGQFPAKLTGELDLFDDMGLVARLDRSQELHHLHAEVIERMRNYIDWAETGMLQETYANNPRRATVFQRYGSPYCAEFYNPHITIARLKNSILSESPLIQKTKIAKYSWSVQDFDLVKKKNGVYHLVRKFRQG